MQTSESVIDRNFDFDPESRVPWRYKMESATQPETVYTNRARNLVAHIIDDPSERTYALLDEDDEEDEAFHAVYAREAAMHAVADAAQSYYLQGNHDHIAIMSNDEMECLLMPSGERSTWITTIEKSVWTSAIPLFLVGSRTMDRRWPEGNVRMLDVETDLTFLRSLDHQARLARFSTCG